MSFRKQTDCHAISSVTRMLCFHTKKLNLELIRLATDSFPVVHLERTMEPALENLRQATKCLMCRENREELKILKCFHVFCENCLAEHVQLDQEGNTLSCPLCKTNTCLPRCRDFSSLETSSLHSHMKQVLSITEPNEATGTGLPTCSCKKRDPSTSYCCECLRYFCVECFNAHEVLHEGHRILDLNELQEHDYKVLFRQPSFCRNPRHANENLKYYCRTCESCICEKCFQQDHLELHDILDLETAADRQNTIFREQLRQLDAKEATEQENMRTIEDKVCKMKENAENLKTQVIKSAKELINFIQENERHLLRQIDEEVTSLIDRQKGQECILKQLRTAREHVTRLTKYATADQAINCKDLLEQRLRELFAIKTELNDIDYNIEFIPSSELYQLQEFGLGSVRKVKPVIDASKSSVYTLESDLQYRQALHTTSLEVSLKDSSGEPSRSSSSNIVVNINPIKDVKNVKVSENTEGKCHVEFVPKVPGQFIVSVMVNGEHVSNSPQRLDVIPQEMKFRGDFIMTGINTPLMQPSGIAVNKPNTKIAITDQQSSCVVICNTEGVFLNKITGPRNKRLKYPQGVAFLNDDDIVVADSGNNRIVIFNTTTTMMLKCFGRQGNGPGEFKHTCGVHVDERGRIIVCCDNRVQVFTGDGVYLFQLDNHLCGEDFYTYFAISHGDLLIVSDWGNDIIHVVEEQGSASLTRRCVIGGLLGSNDGELRCLEGLAVDNDDNLLVCDDSRVQKFTLDGRFVGKTCTENIPDPRYLTVLADGRILVTCLYGNAIKIVT